MAILAVQFHRLDSFLPICRTWGCKQAIWLVFLHSDFFDSPFCALRCYRQVGRGARPCVCVSASGKSFQPRLIGLFERRCAVQCTRHATGCDSRAEPKKKKGEKSSLDRRVEHNQDGCKERQSVTYGRVALFIQVPTSLFFPVVFSL